MHFSHPVCPKPTRYAFAPHVPKEQAGRPLFSPNVLMDLGRNCRGASVATRRATIRHGWPSVATPIVVSRKFG